MIEIRRQVVIPSRPADVWQVLSDPSAVVHCIPGAALESQEGESFAGKMTIAFGAMRVPFRGKGTLVLDEAAQSGTLTGQGRDFNGGTRFSAQAAFTVTPDGEGSAVDLTGTITLAGKLASLIETGAGVVVESMLADFAANLTAATTSTTPAPATAAPAAASVRIPVRIWLRGILAALRSLLRNRGNRR
jgi:carbon monoxide dehydrogenase subunit G